MNIQFYGTHDSLAEYNSKPISYVSFFYLVSFVLLGAMIIMNLFIGVIMNSMQESHQEMEREKISKSPQSENFAGIINELDRKIDALKSDLSKLKNVVR